MRGLGERGLACPLLVIGDGAPGLIGAAERTMGAALRQRCRIHRARNIVAKVPTMWFPRNRGGFPMPLPAWSWIP
ncbi:transposase [Mycobacterium pyrenivorans]|nr:transposase [Mycolicibacterium pyrenivorans]